MKIILLLTLFAGCASKIPTSKTYDEGMKFCQAHAQRFQFPYYGLLIMRDGAQCCYFNSPGGNGTIVTIKTLEGIK